MLTYNDTPDTDVRALTDLAYKMGASDHAALVTAEAEALEAIAAHTATIRRLSAELRVAKAETARLRDILKMRGVRA